MPASPDRRPSNASQHSLSPGPGSQPPPPLSAVPVAEEPEADSKDSADASAAKEHEADGAAAVDDQQSEAQDTTAKTRGPARLAKIIDDYEAQSSEELNLMSGDVVTIINRGSEEEPRWKGEYHGKKGYFPAHVVEPIEESAELDEDEGDGDGSAKPRGFKLAAYGVQQGGLGSIFAGAGVPALRKSAPRKNDSEDGTDQQTSAGQVAAAPAMAPIVPKLRSVQRPPPKEEQPKEEQPNFLAHLNRVPRKSAPSDDSPSPAPLASVPMLPISRRSTAASSLVDAESEKKKAEDEVAKQETAESIKEGSHEHAVSEQDDADFANNNDFASNNLPEDKPRSISQESAAVSHTDAADSIAEQQPEDEYDVADNEGSNAIETESSVQPAAEPAEESAEEDSEGAKSDAAGSSKSSLDPVKSPALPQVKRLVRR
ncbi:hypothetical protein IWW45_009425, partial [Coemansia sp. RSA 485]